MSYYEGLAFFLCLIGVLLIAAVLGYLEKPLKWFSFVVSLLFVAGVFWGSWLNFLYLVLFYVWSLVLILGYFSIRQKGGRKEGIYHVFVLLSLVPLVICKVSPLFHMSLFGFIGISYLTFRVVQMIIEIYDGVIKEVSALEITAFLAFFPSFSSGPIDRSRRVLADWNRVLKREEYMELCGTGIWKLLLGAVYKMVIAAGAYKVMGYFDTGTAWYHWVGYAYAYGIYLFFDFAGYSLFAVGISYIMGVETPVNFNKPFISKNIKEFWNRWHMSLSFWFRDYIYMRFVFFVMKNKLMKNRVHIASVGYLLLFLIMGFWHGLTWYYIVYGLYHACAIILCDAWLRFKKKHKDKLPHNKFTECLAIFVTFNVVCFSFLIFSGFLDTLFFAK